MEQKYTLLTGLLIPIALIIAAYILSSSSLSVRTTQTSVTEDGSLTNAISVSGDGTAVTEPDLVIISTTVQERDYSTKEAQRKTNEKIEQIINIAKKNGVKEEKIKTTQLSIRPVYEYENRKRVFKGYDATQTLSIESAYSKGSENVSSILDQISAIPEVQINSIKFDFENKKQLAEQARELAYTSAEEKAQQLADLSGVSLGKPISITDQSNQFNQANSNDYDMAYAMAPNAVGESKAVTNILSGELEHKVVIHVVYAIE